MRRQLLLLLIGIVTVYGLGQCPDTQLITQCFGPPCNPRWFNWIGGCTSEMKPRTSKQVEIQNQLDTVFHILPDSSQYSLDYIEQVMIKTEKVSNKIYKYLFQDKTGTIPQFKDAIKAVEDIVTKMGMNNPQHDVVQWITQNIEKEGNYYNVENTLNKIQTYYKQIFNTLDETFKLSKQQRLLEQFDIYSYQLRAGVTPQEQIQDNLFVIDTDLKATLDVYLNDETGLMKNGYYTYQLLIHTAILHINVKSLLALASSDPKVQKECMTEANTIYSKYKSLFDQYTKKAIEFRSQFVTPVQCHTGADPTCSQSQCLRNSYSWEDKMRNIQVEESYMIITQETQFYNLCTIYGEVTFGRELMGERDLYLKQLQTKMQEVFDIYKQNYQKILTGINFLQSQSIFF